MFFSIRSYLLIFAIFLLAVNLTKCELVTISKLIIFCWSIKMLFSIIIPHKYPLFRNILGYDGIIYFAGDEYLTIGIYISIIFIFSYRKNLSYLRYFLIINFIFALTLIAQRKGALPYFTIINCLLFIYFFLNYKIIHKVFNVLLIIYAFTAFIFLWIILPNLPDIIQHALQEYKALSSSALDSLLNLSLFQLTFGITPFGKYELINLPSIFDHKMSFGNEVGEIYRYKLWTVPHGRLLLNVGLIGFIYVNYYLISKSITQNIFVFYLVFAFIPFFYFASITPVTAVAIAFALLVFLKHKYNTIKVTDSHH